MSTITEKAQLIAQDLNGHGLKPGAFDPTLITTIIGVITDVISAFMACKKTPAQAAATMQRAGPVERAAVRSSIRKRTNHIALRSPLLNSTLKVAATTSSDDVQNMMDEVTPSKKS